MTLGDQALALLQKRKTWGVVMQVFTVAFAVLLALLGSEDKPPSKATNALIIVLIAGAQFGSAWAFGKDGKADPALAERSVSRLIGLAARARQAEIATQQAFEGTTRGQALRVELGVMATEFSWMSEGLLQAIEDWRTFHPDAVGRAEGTSADAVE